MDEITGQTKSEPKYIVCKEKEGMFQIFLNRPPMNAFNVEMVEELNSTIAELLYRTDLKVVVFLAAGKNFCGGMSPEDFADDRAYQLMEALGRMYSQLQSLSVPILTVAQGLALGAGFELILFSDLAIATESSKFGLPEIRMGLFPALACNILQRSLPWKRACELILTGELISAPDAEKYGLINYAVPDAKLQEHAGLIVGRLLQYSAPVLQLARKAMTQAQDKPLDEGIRAIEEIYLNDLISLKDSREGVAAFMEKRKAVWRNE